MTVRNQWLRDIAIKAGLVLTGLLSLATLTSCGGGGVEGSTNATGSLTVIPGTAELFPNTPVTFTVSGGKPGYVVVSSNTAAIPVPNPTVSGNTFTLTANDVTADTAVTITVRDNANATTTATANVKVAVLNNQATMTPIAPLAGCGTNGVCSGGDANVTVTALQNNIKLKNRPILFSVYQGQFQFVTPNSFALVNSITITTDENGLAVAKLTVPQAATTQVATLTMTDTTTGLVRYFNFNILQQTSGAGILSSLPSGNTTFPGLDGGTGGASPSTTLGQCPIGGQVDYYIFGGTPPYRIASPLPSFILVATPGSPFAAETILTVNGGYFVAVELGCGQSQLIVTDATNRSIETSQVIGVKGKDAAAAPAPTPTPPSLAASPTTFTLACAGSQTVTLAGVGSYTTNFSTTGITTELTLTPGTGTVPGSITFTRNSGTTPTTIVVNVVNGTIIVPLTITVPATCP